MDKQQIQTMNRFGFSISEIPGKRVPRLTFYKPDGEPLVLLADTYHMERYLKRGLTLSPPKVEAAPSSLETSTAEVNTPPKRKYRFHKKRRST